jgi:hypothetical protein
VTAVSGHSLTMHASGLAPAGSPSPAVQQHVFRTSHCVTRYFVFRVLGDSRWVEAWTLAHPPQEVLFRDDPVMHSYTIVIPSHPCLSNLPLGLCNVYECKMGALARNMSQSSFNEAFVSSRGCLAHRCQTKHFLSSSSYLRLRKRANSVAPGLAFPPQPLRISH